MNIRQLIEQSVAASPKKTYLYFRDLEISYQEFNSNVNRVANGLLGLGAVKGDKVSLMLPNSPEFLYSWFALSKIGAVMVPINLAFKEREVTYILNHSGAKVFLCSGEQLPMITSVRRSCSSLKQVISTVREESAGIVDFHQLLKEHDKDLKWIDVDDGDLAACIYTSGTTGQPKGVMLSHETYVLTGQSYAFSAGLSYQDRLMTPNPMFHINAQVYSAMGTLAANASLILLERFSASRIWEQARYYKANKLVLVLASASILLSRMETEDDDNNPVEKVIAGGTIKGRFREFEKRFGVALQTIYSLTESPVAIMSPLGQVSKDGGIGIPMRHPDPDFKNKVRIVSEDGSEAPLLVVGEVIIKNPAIMKGYYKDPGLTAETIKDGWLYTGDTGYKDEDGYFFFIGRSKDIIRRKGEQIPAAEVEDVINSHPKVSYSAVIGIPAGIADEEVKAYVVLKRDESLPYEELVQWCAAHLADFKVPRYLEYRDDLSRNALDRVRKEVLKQEKIDLAKNCYDRQVQR
ncbi:MAG: AMP-binding protein [Chloroflexota bacterium]|nr:AMP-binding protein [Chloroflexota bacterium]